MFILVFCFPKFFSIEVNLSPSASYMLSNMVYIYNSGYTIKL